MKKSMLCTVAVFVGAAGLLTAPAFAAGEADTEITYTKHIAPIIQRSARPVTARAGSRRCR